MNHTRLAALFLLAFGLLASAQQAAREPLLRPDPAVQAGLQRVLAASTADGQRRELEALRTGAGPTHERLVPQLFLFSQRARDTREAMLFGFVLAELHIPAEHVVRALVPLLESEDRALRAALGNVLSEFEHRSVEHGADFTVYRPLLEQGLALGLVRHLFESDPGAALLVLARVQAREPAELRPLLLAEHEVADALWRLELGFLAPDELARAAPRALQQLDSLARHARWWARLYAAEIALRRPALLSAARLDELRRDEHPLVRAAARAEGR